MFEVTSDIEREGRRLSVIITEPSTLSSNKAVLLITAGLLHKVGPYRMYTLLARKLAELGFLTVRFDLTSIGDSTYIPLNNIAAQSQRDISQVMDHITDNYNISCFFAGGLCAGAEDAFNTAVIDSRIKDVFMLDPNVYETTKSRMKALYYKVLRHSFRKLQSNLYLKELYGRNLPTIEETLFYRKEVDKSIVEGNINSLVNRGCRLLFLFMGGNVNKYNYSNQVHDMYPGVDFNSLIEYKYFKDYDHSALLESDRDQLIILLTNWMCQRK